jgi:ABC-2 type transport system ATP-binding protein
VHHARMDDIGRLTSGAGLTVLELSAEIGTLEQAYLDLTAAEAEFAAQSPTRRPTQPPAPAASSSQSQEA